MVVWQLFQAELLIASRSTRERWASSKLQILWFMFLFFGLVFAFRLTIIIGKTLGFDIGVTPEHLLLMATFAFFVKGAADALHALIENRYTHFLLAQPVQPGALLLARGIVSTLTNCLFITIGLFAFLAIDLLSPQAARTSVPYFGYFELLLVAAFGTACGIGMSIETHRQPLRRRWTALLYSIPLAVVLSVTTNVQMGPAHVVAIAPLTLLVFILLRLRGETLLEVIGVQEREKSSRPVPAFPSVFAPRPSSRPLLQFEWTKYWRSRHHWVALITVVVLGMIGFYFRESILPLLRDFGFLVNSPFAPYLEVVFVFFLSYLAIMLLGAVPAMETVLGEQRTLYLFRAGPFDLRRLTFAKGWHLTPNLAFLALALPIPVGLILQLTPGRIIFSVSAAVGMFALSVGIALVLGAMFIRTTSEEEEAGVVPLYTLLMTCLLIGGGAVAVAGMTFLRYGHLAGWFAVAGFVLASFLFLFGGVRWCASRLAAHEPRGTA